MGNLPAVITISRQLGSGGAYVGQQLAEQLGILYLDREIVIQAAKQLQVLEEDLESRDEKKTSFWQSVLQLSAYTPPDTYMPPEIYIPSDQDLYKAESQIIQKVAKEHSAVIIGRGSSYLLRDHPRHLSIFLHADLAFRQRRVGELYNLTAPEAKKLIEKSDRERGRYLQTLTGRDWNDARTYQLSIDTGKTGLEQAKEIILACIKVQFDIAPK
ncbi:MAG TPA: cytidylate kinase-like family protein [Firmicutes bacterium]|jgi:CMP/dCMP kinase|nr:cytidylate kinase-like family protein [Bacillota bacterium]